MTGMIAMGEQSVALIRKKGIRLRGIRLSRKEYRIAELVITHHCHDDITGVAAIMSEPGLSRKEKERVIPFTSIQDVVYTPPTAMRLACLQLIVAYGQEPLPPSPWPSWG